MMNQYKNPKAYPPETGALCPLNPCISNMVIRVILADDHQMLLDALCSFLEHDRDIKVVGMTSDRGAMHEICASLQPDVIVLGISMPGMIGIETTRRLVEAYPGINVVALSAFPRKEHVLGMLDAGAMAYLIKENSGNELVCALHSVMKGQKYLCKEVVNVVAENSRGNPIEMPNNGFRADAAPDRAPLSHSLPEFHVNLGPREREVLQLLAEGGSSPVIAKRLFISSSTVDVHRRNIMKKLDLHSVAELTKYAVRNGLTYI
jgi:two-component system NarL family response regulator